MSDLHRAECSCGWVGDMLPLLLAEAQAYRHEHDKHPRPTLTLAPAMLVGLRSEEGK